MSMTPDEKRELSRTIRSLRARLLDDLHAATEGAYRLSIREKDAKLSEAARVRRQRLERWIAEQVRALPKKQQAGAAERLRREVEKDAASTWLNRIVYLRLLEAAGLRQEKLVTGGFESRGYKDFREHAPELVQGDASEGYARLLALVFDDLATELPGLYGDVGLTSLIPIPAATLRALVEALDAETLAGCWRDDMTLGWVYQYWNDPEREALDAKLNENKKLENHELASKTQMFTERYMVEWLLQNSLGQMWLAICDKHGWKPEVEADGTLERLEARRKDWRAKREAGQVALDELMPIEGEREEHWKYWVPQPMPADAAQHAPDSLRQLKLLDIAVGSGHFLVVALDLLFALYREEARHRGETGSEPWSDRAIVESILEHNLHGIDIDPRAVQIAAAALMLKAQQLAPGAAPRVMNLVASQLRLANLAQDDAALVELRESLWRQCGIPESATGALLQAVAGADHLGTLLQVDAGVEQALKDAEKLQRSSEQQELFDDGRGRTSVARVGDPQGVHAKLEAFLAQHGGSDDLGLRLRGQQLATGVRLLRMLREGQYDLVVGNPPYQGTSKMADAKYVQGHYPRGKADLYAAFLERGLQLVREGGVSALLTMRNWMFIKQYAGLREWLLQTYDLRMLGDVDRGAFEEVPDEVVAAVMSVFRRAAPGECESVAIQPTPLDDKARDGGRTKRKRAAVLCQVGRFGFRTGDFPTVEDAPLLYWWTHSDFRYYARFEPFGRVAPAREGITTADNARFRRRCWEAGSSAKGWEPFVGGAAGLRWMAPVLELVRWRDLGLEIKTKAGASIRNEKFQRQIGVAFTTIGADFGARMFRVPSIFEAKGRSIFSDSAASVTCVLNTTRAKSIVQSLNPGVDFTVGDVNRLPCFDLDGAISIMAQVGESFDEHESHREPSVEFKRPGPSDWTAVQRWAQRAVDRPEGEPLPPYDPEYDPEPPTDHLSFALGVALGRFGADGEGILDTAPADALPGGILFLSAASEHDSLEHPACAPVLAAWDAHGDAMQQGEKTPRPLRDYLQHRFFGDVHRKMYENRPIYFPLSSHKRSFVAYVSIHRQDADTLRALLAEHLQPAMTRLEGEISDLRAARQSADKKTARDAERRYAQVDKWRAELASFIEALEQCAEKGPPAPDAKTPERERDARYDPDLDDGVMINAAALWPLLEPQWKDPKKWWKELAAASGKKDYDWAHLAARYFPRRVYGKCQSDPSLAVAHACFWKLHPQLAYKWELRLQDEIAPDFKLDESARTEAQAPTPDWHQLPSDHYRSAFEVAHPTQVEALITAEHKRREKKAKKQGDEAKPGDGPLLDRADMAKKAR
ncbi:MAG: BREX-6 system adenine-specific DNA-methyltransferase PglX [Myxococcales bacterium]|nr:BREX-6 system adenine-specific DNA-methyltransferase PglX [Myxococcales bacterium]